MPVASLARSISTSQLSLEVEAVTPVSSPLEEQSSLPLKAHTLDRFAKPGLIAEENESKRKRFMSFRLKKNSKRKDLNNADAVTENCTTDSLDGSDSSTTSVKPKRRHLMRMGSFVRKVAFKVQAASPALPNSPVNSNGVTGSNGVPSVIPCSLPPNPPPNYITFDKEQVPAMVGIRNHGNTCFINAVLQCLSHTDVLAEYFVLDTFKQDLRRCIRIGNRKTLNGQRRGEMTEQVANTLKSLWTLRYVPDVSLALKACVERHDPVYRGGSQHDAAEFLMFLLGKVHDDLNTASKRKYKRIKSSYGRPDEAVATETLNNHLRCNSSFVQDIFQAQFRSSLRCPHCNKESNTFDPFMCVSVPIPHRENMAVFVTLIYLNQQPKEVCLGMTVACGSKCGELRTTIATDCGVSSDCIVLVEVDSTGFHRSFTDEATVDSIGDSVYAVELPLTRVQEDSPFVTLTWVNVEVVGEVVQRFGGVYQSQVARDIIYEDLQKVLLKEMTNMVTLNTLTNKQKSGLFKIVVCDGTSLGSEVVSSTELPLYSQSVDQALALCSSTLLPPHVKLSLHWTVEDKAKYIIDDMEHIDQHASVHQLKDKPPTPPDSSLAECLQLHSSAEQLSSGDAWHCPTCDKKQQGVKRLMLWSAPQILVLHLKRFRQGMLHSNVSSKLNTMVSFPLTQLDITEHVAQRAPASSNKQQTGDTKTPQGGVWSPWRKPKRLCVPQTDQKYLYDLYAVCYHHGKDVLSGHYTAACLNPSTRQWYRFDDSKVTPLTPGEVVTRDSYLLFYQRKGLPAEERTDHWCNRIPKHCLPASLNPPIATRNSKDAECPNDSTPCKGPIVFERGRSYGTLPAQGNRGVNSRTDCLVREESTERDNCSDSEAPPLHAEDSPIKRRISDVVEKVEQEETAMETEKVTPKPPGGARKTVLISRSQAVVKQENLTDNPIPPVLCEKCTLEKCVCVKVQSKQLARTTPDVLIQPASPAVLAAHNKKKSVITVTLRQRSPSQHSHSAVSRSSSTCSVASRSSKVSTVSVTPDTLASIITVNGVTVADSEQLNAEFASSLQAVAGEDDDRRQRLSCHVNDSASYVHVTSPSGKNGKTSPTSNKTSPTSNKTSPTSNKTSPTSDKTSPTSNKTSPTSSKTSPTSCNGHRKARGVSKGSSSPSNVSTAKPLGFSTTVPCMSNGVRENGERCSGERERCSGERERCNGVSERCNGESERLSTLSLDTPSLSSKSPRPRYSSCNFGDRSTTPTPKGTTKGT